jgi:6-hydroxy-3-succinoylpyridine 3-monooxygenase
MQGMPELECLRTRIYIDGYNFYYGCLRGTPHKWLDLLPLFEKHILPSALVSDAEGCIRNSTLLTSPSIKFFTAKIIESVARARDSVSYQARYHTALRKLHGSRIELIEGYYAVNKMKVKIVDAEYPDRLPAILRKFKHGKLRRSRVMSISPCMPITTRLPGRLTML